MYAQSLSSVLCSFHLRLCRFFIKAYGYGHEQHLVAVVGPVNGPLVCDSSVVLHQLEVTLITTFG